MMMSDYPAIVQCALVALAVGLVEVASAENQEQVKDQDYGTDVKVSSSLNIVHWIFIPGLSAVLVVIGCCAFQKYRAMKQSGVGAGQEHVRRVEYKTKTSVPPAPSQSQALHDATAPPSSATAPASSKHNMWSTSKGMGAIILCSESRTSCREAVELLYQDCADLSEFKDIRVVKSASGDALPCVVQVPEAHLPILEERYMSSAILEQLSFVRPSDCTTAVPPVCSPLPVTTSSSLKQKGSESFNEDNDDKV